MASQSFLIVEVHTAPSLQGLAVARFLRSQNLKSRACVLDGQRRELFKVKRAIRSLLSEAYTKASAKDKSLPRIANHAQAIRAFALLPKGALALHVSKVELPASRNPIKRIKGLWTVQIEREQRLGEDLYYVWLNQPRTWKQTIVALGIVFVMLIITMFPLWPPILRLAMWYLAIGILGLMGAFFAMSILRLIIYVGTAVVVPPGLWLYPNLFEDVGFFDSFRPLWGWHSGKKLKKKRAAGMKSEYEKAIIS